MYIKSVNIDEFGKFTDFSVELCRGLNVIEGDNETGKSTFGMFIKFMFYGLNAAEREKYVGWGKNCCRGSMIVVSAGKEYKIERSLILLARGVKESVAIIDENLTPVFADSTPDKVFLGVSEKVFLSSAFVGAVTGTYIDGAKLTDAVENLLFSADETTNTTKALKKLDDDRAALLHKNGKGGELYELKNTIAECEVKLAEAQKANVEIFKTEERLAADKQKRDDNAENASTIRAKLEEYEAYLQIAKVGKCADKKAEADAAEEKYLTKKQELTVDGRLPNSEYVRKLHSLASEISQTEKELEESERILSGAESSLAMSSESADMLDRIEAAGGQTDIVSTVEGFKKRAGGKKTAAIIFGVLGLLLCAGSVVLMSVLDIIYGLIGFGVCILMIVLLIVSILGRKKMLSELDEYVSGFGCEDADSLISRIKEVEDEELIIAKKRNDIENAGQRCHQLRTRLQSKTQEASAFTANYLQVEPNQDALSSEADRIEGELSMLAEMKSESEKQTALYEQLKTETENTDTEKLRARIKGVLKTEELATFNEDEQRNRLKFLEGSITSLDTRILENEKLLSSLTTGTQNPAVLADILGDLKRRYTSGKATYDALMLAHEKLQEASATLRSSICPRLSSEAGTYMKIMSDGKYDSLGIDESYSITAEGDGMTRSISAFSTGTADIAYISVRLALISTLYRNGKPFLMFDDSFAHIDGDRLRAVMALLSVKGRDEDGLQSIVFTSGKREGVICSTLIDSNIIRMKKA